MRSRGNLLAPILFAVIAAILVLSWFREGFLYGGGDVGIPSYDPKRILDIVRFVWWSYSAPGTTVPQGLTSVPFQFAQSLLAGLGIPYVYIQAIFFGMIIFLMGYGMNLLAGTIFGREKKGLAILAGLFYQFNPYMMIEVWHRFIHNTFFLAAALPFIFIFWTKWIRNGRYSSLFTFLLISFLSSYMFGTLAFIAVILVILAWIAVVEILLPWKNFTNFKKISTRFFFGGIFWFLIQAWWMLPSFGIAPALLSAQHSIEGSLSTLLSISEQTIIPYSIFGINPFYLYSNADFGSSYNFTYLRLIPFFALLFLIPGFIKSLMNRTLSAWGLLFILGIFLAKGAAAPFGNAYLFGFSNIFLLGVLRNPFEKMGILIPFSGAILFSLGVNFYFQNPRLRKKKYLVTLGIIIILTLLFGVFQWPVWAGKLFGTSQKPAYVQVPTTYIETDEYIRKQKKNGNILHLPLTTGEAATYYWEHGFSGVESSQLYFNSLPSISRGFNIGYVDDALSALSTIFSLPEANDSRIIDLLRAFNVRFIILHKDMEWRGGLLTNPDVLESTLNSKNFLKREKTFGALTVYQLDENNFAPKLRLSQSIQYINPGKENSYWPWLLKQDSGDLVNPADKKTDSNLTSQSTGLLVLPEVAYSYSDRSVSTKDAIEVLAVTKILPDSPLYFLVSAKENIKLFSMNQTEKFQYRITLAGKRLAESFRIREKKIGANIVPLLQSYQKSLVQLGGLEGGEHSLGAIFARHISVLDYLISTLEGKEKEEAIDSKRMLTAKMKLANLLPDFEIKENHDLPKTNRLISAFLVPYAGTFEVLMALQNGRNLYKDGLMKINLQIDNSVVSLPASLKGSFISYGYLDLTAGLHELGFYSALSENMFTDAGLEKEFELVSQKDKSSFWDFELEPVTGGGWYELSFESWIKAGDKFKVQLIQDSDPPDDSNDGRYMSFNKKFRKNPQKNDWKRYVENINIRPSTTKAKVRFLVESQGKTSFKNIEMKRVLRNPLFLKTALKQGKAEEGALEFKQISPVLYTGRISTMGSKFLIFAQSFHPGWELKLNDGTKEITLSPKYMANLYSNAWYIEKGGDYTFTLEFIPQRLVKTGIIISLAGWSVVCVLSLWQRFRKA